MLALFRSLRHKPTHRGGIDWITPGLISGWVMDAKVPLTDVRLLVGPQLIAQAAINLPRPDVSEMLGIEGNFGFQLRVSDFLPATVGTHVPKVLASSADCQVMVELQHLPARAQTTERLQQVLCAEVCGTVGYFDGLSPDRTALQGWAYRQREMGPAVVQVWLHVEGQAALAVRCDQYRPGMAAQGHAERCGFSMKLESVPASWGGQAVRVSFDAAGQIPLPGAASCSVPALARGSSPFMHPSSGSPYAPRLSEAPTELQQSWQAVEEFRQFLDGLETQITRAEALQREHAKPALYGQRRTRKRDRLLQLLLGGSR